MSPSVNKPRKRCVAARKSTGTLVENINDIFYILDTGGNITYVSPAVERLTKYKVSELTGKPFSHLFTRTTCPAF